MVAIDLAAHQDIRLHALESFHVSAKDAAAEGARGRQVVRIEIVQRAHVADDLDAGKPPERHRP